MLVERESIVEGLPKHRKQLQYKKKNAHVCMHIHKKLLIHLRQELKEILLVAQRDEKLLPPVGPFDWHVCDLRVWTQGLGRSDEGLKI